MLYRYDYESCVEDFELPTRAMLSRRWSNEISRLDTEQYNSNRKHSRRYPKSFDAKRLDEWYSDDSDIINDIIRKEDQALVRKAIESLSSEHQTLFAQKYHIGSTNVSISKAEGVSEAAIRKRLKKLAEQIMGNIIQSGFDKECPSPSYSKAVGKSAKIRNKNDDADPA